MQPDPQAGAVPLLEVRDLCKSFISRRILTTTRTVVAARDVSFRIDRGEAVALVGESGSGKSTLARIVLRLERADSGVVLLDGEDVFAAEPRHASLRYRGRVQMVFQDPFGSLNSIHSVAHHLERPILRHGALNPSHGVAHQLERPLIRHHAVNRTRDVPSRLSQLLPRHRRNRSAELREKAIELLRTVGLEPAAEFIDRYPHELSGGQRQRVSIARALAVDPDLLVADEPTSMLDVSIRMDILNLLSRLKRERELAILLITHDLASARYLADRVLVLFQGRVVEDGTTQDVIDSPSHPYTRILLESTADASAADHETSAPEPKRLTDGIAVATGCPFAFRCPEVLDRCRVSDPAPRLLGNRRVRCHLYPETDGMGAA